MAVIKCKMCGDDLVLVPGSTVAVCESCGTQQTVPNVDDEKKLTQFARANRLRAACEFDKAAVVYESIVADFPEEAEAYWGLVLCKYGIEYVDDPATGKKIPTCHRSSFDSIMEDSDFEQALENADVLARKVYREEAKQIEEIRKGIIAVSANEKPYDIFICYKETDENGGRTLDSVLAQDIYDALTDKDYRVFFSRITLEDKLGQEYEPYIFAALNSAKIMLVVGTDYEYFNAVWVKNEWSRFLKLMAKDKDKHLIPCFKGIDAYDMPKEFARLQAQDLGKVGATQDLLRGIGKILPKEQKNTVVIQERIIQERVVGASAGNPGASTVSTMLERGKLALEDSEWNKANSFFESVLNSDPRNAAAYLGKALAQEKCSTLDAFVTKRKGIYPQQMPIQKLQYPADSKHINEMAQRYEVPGCLSAQEIQDLYTEQQVYASGVPDRRKQYKEEESYWTNHKQLSRAMQFATGDLAEQLQQARNTIFDFHDHRVKQAEQSEAASKAKAQRNYAEYLSKIDKTVMQMYEAAIQQRQARYQELLQVAETSREPWELMEAAETFDSYGDYEDSHKMFTLCKKRAEEALVLRKSQYPLAKNMIVAGHKYCAALKSDGTVVITSTDKEWAGIHQWKGIVSLSGGTYHAVGLRYDGTVMAAGSTHLHGSTHVSGWRNIIAVAAGDYHTVGLKADGTVISTKYITGEYDSKSLNDDFGQTEVGDWTGIIAIAAGKHHTVGLKSDGTVIVTEYTNKREYGIYADRKRKNTDENYGQFDVPGWKDIVAIAAQGDTTVGLKADGTVVTVGYGDFKEAKHWRDIVAISLNHSHLIGLKADGTVVAAGYTGDGVGDVGDWKGIVAIATNSDHTIGLKADGTVMATMPEKSRPEDECDVSGWKLFESLDTLEQERAAVIDAFRQRDAIRLWQQTGRCQHCGGELKGFFGKKCVSCGKPKDY